MRGFLVARESCEREKEKEQEGGMEAYNLEEAGVEVEDARGVQYEMTERNFPMVFARIEEYGRGGVWGRGRVGKNRAEVVARLAGDVIRVDCMKNPEFWLEVEAPQEYPCEKEARGWRIEMCTADCHKCATPDDERWWLLHTTMEPKEKVVVQFDAEANARADSTAKPGFWLEFNVQKGPRRAEPLWQEEKSAE